MYMKRDTTNSGPYSRNAGKETALVVVLSPKPVALSHQASDPPWVTSVDAIKYTA